MIEIVDNFLDEFGLNITDNTQQNTFLVGFSGGADSLCLLDIFHVLSSKYGFKLVAMHLNHNWRGDESRLEEANCAQFCEKIGIEYISETMSESGPKTESFAREARYDFFLKCAKKYPNSSIFTAHTSTDNAETIIYRIIKGTGVNGIQGILPKRLVDEIPLYRPLLTISRNKIEDYCNSKGLVANNDSSNLNTNYKRNFIRHKIMPLFEEINFHAEKSIVSLAQLAISHTNIVNEYIAQIMGDLCVGERLLTAKFKNLSEDVMTQIIYNACLKYELDYDRKKIENILNFIKSNFDSKSGSRYSLTNDLWLFVNAHHIYVITKIKGTENKSEICISKEGQYEVPGTNFIFSIKSYMPDGDLKFPKETEKIAYISIEELSNLTVRTRRDGDVITPFGMSGNMKLKKYLNSKGVSQHEKNELILLCNATEVLWVAGVGISNKLRVENQPTHVIELKNKKN